MSFDWSYLFIYLFIYLFLAMLGLCCWVQAFSSCCEWGLLFVAVRGLLMAVASRCGAWALGTWASVVVACGLSSCGLRALERRLSSCGAWASLLYSMWDLPGPGLEPVSPALAGGFLTTVWPGKPLIGALFHWHLKWLLISKYLLTFFYLFSACSCSYYLFFF